MNAFDLTYLIVRDNPGYVLSLLLLCVSLVFLLLMQNKTWFRRLIFVGLPRSLFDNVRGLPKKSIRHESEALRTLSAHFSSEISRFEKLRQGMDRQVTPPKRRASDVH